MAVSGNLKARVLEQNLPYLTLFHDLQFGYIVRYRIVSEDLNRYSHYSPQYRVLPNYVFERPYGRLISDIYVASEGPYVKVVFDSISIKDKVSNNEVRKAIEYDVWLRWDKNDGGAWIYQERVEGTTLGFYKPEEYTLANGTLVEQTPNRLSVEIYLRSTNPQRVTPVATAHPLLVYKLDGTTV